MAQLPDNALVEELKKHLAKHKSGKLFVLLHCYGSHFNYYDRYDRKGAYYTPDEIPSASNKYRSNMMNAYDNSIRETDILLAGVINALKDTHMSAAMCYVSDHGEDISMIHANASFTHLQSQLITNFVCRLSCGLRRNSNRHSPKSGKLLWQTRKSLLPPTVSLSTRCSTLAVSPPASLRQMRQ